LRETWDRLWLKRAVLDVNEVISVDSCYHLLRRLIEPLPDNGLNILEVGCGTGIRTLSLLKRSQCCLPNSAVLVDYSRTALALAMKNAERNGLRVNLVLADAFKLSFPDNTFDIVWNGGVNEHFRGEARQLIFNEMARVCKPGGQVIVIVPNSLNLPYRLWKGVFERRGEWEYGLEIPYSIFELRSKLRNAGLVPVKVSGGGTLASLSFLFRLIHRRRKHDSAEAPATIRSIRILRKIVLKTDSLLKVIGGFTGADIGIKALKHGD